MKAQLVVIGGGPAGLGAALSARKHGTQDIVILEREERTGGILKQCIHSGFGLHKFGEELTGPEYAYKYEKAVEDENIRIMTGTTVLKLEKSKRVTAVNKEYGVFEIEAEAVILAMGCRERPRGALNIPGSRCAGIYTAGTAQKFVNVHGLLPGKKVLILGSGDIGLIMARRLTLEGAEVVGVCEIMDYSGGLARNIEQCLNDFNIPLYLSRTVTKIYGNDRVCGVAVASVGADRRVIKGTEEYIECDTLLLSVGLLPENELTRAAGIAIDKKTGGAVCDERRETGAEGIFACGNVLHVHDLADYVSDEAEIAGKSAAEYISGKQAGGEKFTVAAGDGVRCTVPARIGKNASAEIFFRVSKPMENALFTLCCDGKILREIKKVKASPGTMEKISVENAQGDITVCAREVM